jgi:Tol biopolymer transport system component
MKYILHIILLFVISAPFVHAADYAADSLVSFGTSGESNGHSVIGDRSLDMSYDGRYVVFVSEADNLVPNDNNNRRDVFLFDRQNPQTLKLVSKTATGESSSGHSYDPQISGDGSAVVFTSESDDLMAGEFNQASSVYAYYPATDTMKLVSKCYVCTPFGTEDPSHSPAVSYDGRYVAFATSSVDFVAGDTNNTVDVVVRDMVANTHTRVSVSDSEAQSNSASYYPDISDDGNRVVFLSAATNLGLPDTNGGTDIFLRDIALGTTTMISRESPLVEFDQKSQYPQISGDGSTVAFVTYANNFFGNPLGVAQIFVHNVLTGQKELVSKNSSGVSANKSSLYPFVSRDGRYVGFVSSANNMNTADTLEKFDGYIYDRAQGSLSVVLSSTKQFLGNNSERIVFSNDAQHVAFATEAQNVLSAPSVNIFRDVYLAQPIPPAPTRSYGYVNYTCRDITATNYKKTGRHRASLCTYPKKTIVPTVTAAQRSCPIFTQRMRKGDRDGSLAQSKQAKGISTTITEVRLLQRTLKEQGFFTGTPNGVFGPQTEKAVRAWQQTHREFVLDPWGYLKGPTGWFYQSSERWMNELLGCEDTVTLDTGTRLDVRYRDR